MHIDLPRPFRFANRFSYVVAGAVLLLALAIVAATLLIDRARISADMVRADPDAILAAPALRNAALSIGRSVYHAHCAVCHGVAGGGGAAAGVPDFRDRDWLYGEGRVSEIEAIVRYGIRARNSKGWNLASMPAYASERPYAAEPIPSLTPGEVDDIVRLLLHYEGRSADPAAVARGQRVYQKGGCWDCHGPDGHGDPAVGAPNLRDGITLYGGSPAALTRTVEQGRHGMSPAFASTLDAVQISAVAVYVASLSPTEPSAAKALP